MTKNPTSNGLTKEQLTLLAISFARGSSLSPLQLQKAVFLFQENLPASAITSKYDFIAYNYGPFCADIYDDAEKLSEMDFAQIDTSGKYSTYSATIEGIENGDEVASRLTPEVAAFAQRIVDWVKRQTFAGLVKAIYDKYPEYRVNSIFQG